MILPEGSIDDMHKKKYLCHSFCLTIHFFTIPQYSYESPEISGHECAFDVRPPSSASYRGGRAGAQLTAQSERIRSWLVANRFQAVSQASMMSARLVNTELASQWLRR